MTMYCQNCGTLNEDTISNCEVCGQPLNTTAPLGSSRSDLPNYLPQAIVVTLFCCLPFGIVAIVYAAQVNGKLHSGDFEGAKRSSQAAKLWCWISFWTAISLLGFLILTEFFPSL